LNIITVIPVIIEGSFMRNDSSEIMTPYFEANKYQPFSRVSVASLADLGYQVNMSAADPLIVTFHAKHDKNNVRKLDTENKDDTATDSAIDTDDDDIVHQKPSRTFLLDSTNVVRPDVIHIFD
jgi:hypothetical protein